MERTSADRRWFDAGDGFKDTSVDSKRLRDLGGLDGDTDIISVVIRGETDGPVVGQAMSSEVSTMGHELVNRANNGAAQVVTTSCMRDLVTFVAVLLRREDKVNCGSSLDFMIRGVFVVETSCSGKENDVVQVECLVI